MRRSPAERETQEVADEARRLFFYHAETGLILRRVYQMGKHVGEEADHERAPSDGIIYRILHIRRVSFLSHRVAWLLHYGRWPSKNIDHRDGDGRNNKIDNLREAGPKQNSLNLKLNSSNSTGVTGVYWKKQSRKWIACIGQNRKQIHLGSFDSFEGAVTARKEAERKYGFSERHGTKGPDVVTSATGY